MFTAAITFPISQHISLPLKLGDSWARASFRGPEEIQRLPQPRAEQMDTAPRRTTFSNDRRGLAAEKRLSEKQWTR